MKYIVYTTEGQYSSFGVNGVLVGDVEPITVLDALTDKMSDGVWKKFEDMSIRTYSDRTMYALDNEMIIAIRKKAVETLEAVGFVEHEASEVWLG